MGDYGLLFYLTEEFNEADAQSIKELVVHLASTGEWSAHRPEVIDDLDDEVLAEGDEPIWTVGGFLELPPPEESPDVETELVHHAEVSRIVDALAEFSRERGCVIKLVIGGTATGEIVKGDIGEAIRVGLLDAWRDWLTERG